MLMKTSTNAILVKVLVLIVVLVLSSNLSKAERHEEGERAWERERERERERRGGRDSGRDRERERERVIYPTLGLYGLGLGRRVLQGKTILEVSQQCPERNLKPERDLMITG